MALRDHLGADENVDIACAKPAKDPLVIAHVAHRVAIDAAHARIRK